jgi:small GTP-binding protein
MSSLGPNTDPSLLSGDFTLHSLLNREQKELLRSIKTALTQATVDLRPLNISKADAQLLRGAAEALDELFLIVVVGEFNAGKSNFINALLGANHCRTGPLPTTETIQILRYGDKREEKLTGPDNSVRTVSVPVPWLRQANLVDTPGTNAVVDKHQEITEKFVPSADLVLFVTSVERPFTESERQFLTRIHAWKKKVVIAINKADLYVPNMDTQGFSDLFTHQPEAKPDADAAADPAAPTTFGHILDYVRSHSKSVLAESPPVFGVSAKLALQGKLAVAAAAAPGPDQPRLSPASAAAASAQGHALFSNSGFADLERYILSQLTAENKIRLKLRSPLSLAEHLIGKYSAVLEARMDALARDVATREMLLHEIEDFSVEAQADYERQLVQLDNTFLRMKHAAAAFLTEQVRFLNMPSLVFRKEKLRTDFTAQVHHGVSEEVADTVRAVSSWLVSKTARQAHSLANLMSRAAPAPMPALAPTTGFEARAPLFSSAAEEPAAEEDVYALDVMQTAEAVRAAGVDFHQARLESIKEMQLQCAATVSETARAEQTQRMVQSLMTGSLAAASLEVSAVGLAAVCATMLMDVTGLAGAGAAAVAGLVVLPSQRTHLTRQMNARVDAMHAELRSTLSAQYAKEVEAARHHLTGAVGPFVRYVTHEEERLAELKTQVDSVRAEIRRLSAQLDK